MTTNVMYVIVTKLGRFHRICNCTAFNAFYNYLSLWWWCWGTRRCNILLQLGDQTLLNLGGVGCENWPWMELASDRVQWWALVLAVLNFCVLRPEI